MDGNDKPAAGQHNGNSTRYIGIRVEQVKRKYCRVLPIVNEQRRICALMRRPKFDLVVTAVSLAMLGYLGWHGFDGPRGFPYRDRLQAEAGKLDLDLAAIRARREALELKVSHLRPQSIDADLLDEMARSMLGMTGPGELVVLRKAQNPQENP